MARELAVKLRGLRLDRGWRQETLAERSGVSLGSLRRFERTGEVSLKHLLRLAFTLDRLGDFDDALEPPPAASMVELEAMSKTRRPVRGRK